MELSNYQKMDPHLLVGVINTTLRNHCDSLEDLCKTYDLEEPLLVERLRTAGYDYQPAQKQFR